MTTLIKPIPLGSPDASGDIYPSTFTALLTLANPKLQDCMVMEFPTGSDIGLETSVEVPQGYVGSPVLVIRGVLDGTPANVLAFAVQQLSRADSESIDTAYETEDIASNSTWTGYADEDYYVETVTLTPASPYVAGDIILIKLDRDDNVDTTTFNFLLTHLGFQYSDS